MSATFETEVRRETTLPTEILREISEATEGKYSLKQLDDTAMWAASGPVMAAATAGRADASELTVYLAAGIYGGAMMAEYINAGLLDPEKISRWVDEIPAKLAAQEASPDEE